MVAPVIRPLPRIDRRRRRALSRRQWKVVFLPFAILHVEGLGRSRVIMQRMETRWSETANRRLWRIPA